MPRKQLGCALSVLSGHVVAAGRRRVSSLRFEGSPSAFGVLVTPCVRECSDAEKPAADTTVQSPEQVTAAHFLHPLQMRP